MKPPRDRSAALLRAAAACDAANREAAAIILADRTGRYECLVAWAERFLARVNRNQPPAPPQD
jgi:hypothetical protein